jgi:hypothetical protein
MGLCNATIRNYGSKYELSFKQNNSTTIASVIPKGYYCIENISFNDTGGYVTMFWNRSRSGTFDQGIVYHTEYTIENKGR